jgi:hypothetical protein
MRPPPNEYVTGPASNFNNIGADSEGILARMMRPNLTGDRFGLLCPISISGYVALQGKLVQKCQQM